MKAAAKTRYSMWGEVVTTQASVDSNGWEIVPPPQGLLLAAASRLAQLDDLAEDRREEIAAASAAAATAVSIAVVEKLNKLQAEKEAMALIMEETQQCVEAEPDEPLGESIADVRLHADQQGWRMHPADEAMSRGNTYREWVATHVGRAGSDLTPDDAEPDVVRGLWTCCESLDPCSTGCLEANHSDEMLHCYRCGRWVRRSDWGYEECNHHLDEPEQQRWGSLEWRCCGKGGIKDSKYGKVGVTNPLRTDQKYGLQFKDSFRSNLHRKDRRKAVSATVPIGMRWAMMCQQKRATAIETAARNGCVIGRHAYSFRPCCSHCDAQLVPEGSVGNGTRAAMTMRMGGPSRVCSICKTVNRICMQCEKVIPEPGPPGGPAPDPPRVNPPAHPPAAAYVTPYQMPGAPPGPGPPPPPRYSLAPPSYGGFEAPCRFHPGVWCAFRSTRMALRQKKAEPLVVYEPPALIPPPPPSPPRERPASPPRDPPPTVKPTSPRRWESQGVQTNPPKGKPIARGTQTISFHDVSTQFPIPPAENPSTASQTEMLEPAWCKHTTKSEAHNPSQSLIVRTWSSLPRDFVKPSDKFSEDHFANGGHGMRQRMERRVTGESTYLRGLLEFKRSRNANLTRLAASLIDPDPNMPSLRGSFRVWLAHARHMRRALELLMPAAVKIASISRWSHVFAPAPPASTAITANSDEFKYGIGYDGSVARVRVTVTDRIKLVHAFVRWATQASEEMVTIRAELQWVGVRMRFGVLAEAFWRWSGEVNGVQLSPEQPGRPAKAELETTLSTVKSALRWKRNAASRQALSLGSSLRRNSSPMFGATAAGDAKRAAVEPPVHGQLGYPAPLKIDCDAQTDRSWEWQSEVERRGLIHWPVTTVEAAIQTSRRSFVIGHQQDAVGTQTDFAPVKLQSAEVQTDYHDTYGELNLTRRTGNAAENKIAAMQKANPDPTVRKAVLAANLRVAAKRAELADQGAALRLRAALREAVTTTTWAYSEKDRQRLVRSQTSLADAQRGSRRSILETPKKPPGMQGPARSPAPRQIERHADARQESPPWYLPSTPLSPVDDSAELVQGIGDDDFVAFRALTQDESDALASAGLQSISAVAAAITANLSALNAAAGAHLAEDMPISSSPAVASTPTAAFTRIDSSPKHTRELDSVYDKPVQL